MKLSKNKLFIIIKNYLFVIGTVVMLFLIGFKLYDFYTLDGYLLNQEKYEIETKTAVIQEEIDLIKEKQKYLKTEDGKERVKRQVSLYKKPGEKVIHIVDF